MESDKMEKGTIISNVLNFTATLVLLLAFVYGLSNWVVKYFVAQGVEWIGPTDLGLMVIGFFGAIIFATNNWVINRALNKYYAKGANNNASNETANKAPTE